MAICSVEGCDRSVWARGYCNYHYNLFRKTGKLRIGEYLKNPQECIVDGCRRPPKAKGLCEMHYARYKKHGTAGTANYIREPHGLRRLPEYQVWKSMKARCNNINDDFYHRYGGRGISVCEDWAKSFPSFIGDMGRRPSSNHQIDRIDNDGDYAPNNCRWSTCADNVRNNSHTKLTVKNVINIKNLHKGGMSIINISYLYPVAETTIRCVISGKTWKDIA